MPMIGSEMIEAAKQEVSPMPPREAYSKLQSGERLVVLDIREREEWEEGHIAQATLLTRGSLEGRVEDMIPDKNTPIITH